MEDTSLEEAGARVKIPTWLTVAVVAVFTGLIGAAIVVGLIRDNIDTNGLVLALTSVVSGILVTTVIKGGGGGGGNDGKHREGP